LLVAASSDGAASPPSPTNAGGAAQLSQPPPLSQLSPVQVLVQAVPYGNGYAQHAPAYAAAGPAFAAQMAPQSFDNGAAA